MSVGLEQTVSQKTGRDPRAEIGLTVPPEIRFGTSSWNYPGWKGTIYHREYKDDAALRANALEEYAQYPLFRTVGIDSTFYAPARLDTLRRYASQVAPDFRWVAKVWEEITAPAFPGIPRYGKKAGEKNENFLNSELFLNRVLPPFMEPNVSPHLGALVFQFPTMELSHPEAQLRFIEQLETFLKALPREVRYAVEIRNPSLLEQPVAKRYFEVLNFYGVTHCFNHWTSMPRLRTQMIAAAENGGIEAPFFVARLLTPLGWKYEQAVRKFSPYNELRQVQKDMREDIVRLCRRAIERKTAAYILVNNRSEGYAPETVRGITELLQRSLQEHPLQPSPSVIER